MKNSRPINGCAFVTVSTNVGKMAASTSPTRSESIRSPGGAAKNKTIDEFYKDKILEQRALSKVPCPSSLKAFLDPPSSISQSLDKEYCSGESLDSMASDDFTLTKQRMQLMRKSRPGQLVDEVLGSEMKGTDSQRGGQWEYDSESDDESIWEWEDREKRIKVLNKCM